MDIHHERGKGCRGGAHGCGGSCRKSPKPVVRPTFDIKARPVETVREPGTHIGDAVNTPRTCDCDACKELYAELTAQSA
ncbi:hypothetical protein [Streptacidiphilus sp. EB103A]|uniref:hypothetical protein n=1 Tax=Streptacidiphilus sp. EB103A TaxID=3156275 RepID=UPI003512DE90